VSAIAKKYKRGIPYVYKKQQIRKFVERGD